jgi:hypothetical protein
VTGGRADHDAWRAHIVTQVVVLNSRLVSDGGDVPRARNQERGRARSSKRWVLVATTPHSDRDGL